MNDTGGGELIRSVWSSGVSEITSDVAEMFLDSALDEGILRDIPVFGWFAKTYGLVANIRDRIFLQKIARFLLGSRATTAEERKTFSEKMATDSKCQRRIGESIFLLLDRHESIDKSEILGRVFAAFVRDEITYDEFERYSFIIDRLFLRDLENLSSHYSNVTKYSEAQERRENVSFKQFLDERTTQALFVNGLLNSNGWVETTYQCNDLGGRLIRFINPIV